MPTEIASGIELHWEWYSPVIVLLAMGLILFCVSIFFQQTASTSKGRSSANVLLPTPRPLGTLPEQQSESRSQGQPVRLLALPPAAGPTNRRKSVRRKGAAVRILVTTGSPGEEPFQAWVTNRSKGGLSIVSTRAFAAESLLKVRMIHAPDALPWVQVQVRSCRPKGLRWTLGCQFVEDLPWAVLLLFG